ncbi:hypothetical protein Ssi03_55970 [Sphaerisporangium siamense]|uniref:Uncharacterized protein YukJ n=1 Tax=Sphaerisporangium siamense TaxID=795645 RepID=A0A7W7DDG7_9ACTN|nr:DUF2278 family protein [Sphaerisporangium siamense]MBB4703398.1 uncharacterized protein YukJ [Sphaerisporangium siamense]GII87607.1 hypothetical protein Ssi03_55970 [Sphaerisporangium siamense]
MPLRSYGVLAARAVARRREGASETPHYQIHLADQAGTAYRAAVNVLSQQAPSELLYLAVEDFAHPLLQTLPAPGAGWTPLASGPGGAALDFIRGNLFDPALMRPLPPEVTGDDNDLGDKLDHYVRRAIGDPGASVYVFGERWGPEPSTRDKIFGFLPGNGVHDVHMNQGNSGRFHQDDGVWQDGGLLIHLPGESRWIAIFLAFQSQAWHTDDVTGHSLVAAPGRPAAGEEPVRIVAALANPVGPAPENETVTVLNASAAPVDLAGWSLSDRAKHLRPLPPGPLAAGAFLTLPAGPELQLGNGGGAITLLDPAGLKVHGVAYTADQARREGWTLTF